MKWGTIDHPKMAELAAYLGVHHLLAVGIIEALCHWTAKYVPTGGIGKFSNSAIAAGVKWSGDADALVSALVKARWVDEVVAAHRLFVHDWPEHCDKHTHERVKALGVNFDDGTPPFSRKPGPKQKLRNSSGDRPEIVGNSTPALARALPEPEPLTPQPPAVAGGGAPTRRRDRRTAEPLPPPIPPELDTPSFRAAWSEYAAFRRANGWKTLKPASIDAQFGRMVPWGADAAIRALRDSIANGWQGVFEPKSGPGPPAGKPRDYTALVEQALAETPENSRGSERHRRPA